MVRYDVTFTGRVQGVFFRKTTLDVARSFRVTGWVRNEPDGTVRCVCEGAEDELDRFVAAVVRAKRGHVDDTRIVRADAEGAFDGFEIRR